MPYGISQNQPDCSGWATVMQTDNGYDTVGCHQTKQDAIDQMVAISLDEDTEPLGEVGERQQEDRAEGYSPTAGMKEEAQRGLDWRAEFGRGGTEVGVARARDIVNGKNLPIETVRRMHSFFSRHEVDKQGQGFSPGEDGFPSAGRIAWALWGGDPGQSWARKIVEAERAAPATGKNAHSIVGKESEDTMTDTITHRELPPSYRPSDSEDVPVIKPSCASCEYFCMAPDMEGGEAVPHCHRWMAAVEPTAYCDAYEPAEEEEEGMGEASPGMLEEDGWGKKKDKEMKSVSWVAVNEDEKRAIAYTNLELRAEGGSNKLFGYAAVFDSPSEPMPFREYVRRGAFTKTLKDGADVRLLVDHSGIPLARTKSGTLRLWEDEIGLAMETELDEANPLAATVISAMRRGDMTQMSFAFRTIKDSWDEGGMVRELREVQLYDVSIVTYPAYEATMVQLRAAQDSVTIPQSAPILLRKNQVRLARLGKPGHSHQ